jgi:hypothetical protein
MLYDGCGGIWYCSGDDVHDFKHLISNNWLIVVGVGRYEAAMEAAETIKRNLPSSVLSNAVLATYFESFVSVHLHVLVRFGKWDEILALPIPSDNQVS